MIEINDYNKLFINNKVKLTYIWILITIFIVFSVIIFMKNITYEEFYQNKGIGTKEGYIKALIDIEDIELLTDKNNIIIDNKNYKYKIVGFNEELNQVGTQIFQEVFITTEAKILENRYISFKVPVKKYNFLNYIINKIRGNI